MFLVSSLPFAPTLRSRGGGLEPLASGVVLRPAYVTTVGYNISNRVSKAKIQEPGPGVAQVPSQRFAWMVVKECRCRLSEVREAGCVGDKATKW